MALHKIVSRFDGRTLYECEADSICSALQQAVKARANLAYANLASANLDSANLDSANLAYANLASANLASANLDSANLDSANLAYANLARANLCVANLSGAYLYGATWGEKRILNIVQVSGIGSARRSTTAIILPDETLIQCGRFRGTLEQFAGEIEATHANNARCLAEYRAAVEWIEACAVACKEAA